MIHLNKNHLGAGILVASVLGMAIWINQQPVANRAPASPDRSDLAGSAAGTLDPGAAVSNATPKAGLPVWLSGSQPVVGVGSRPALPSGSAASQSAASQYKKELADYAHLRQKVFLSEEDHALKKELFANRELLLGLGQYLGQPAHNFEAQSEQTAALDLLLEALKSTEGHKAADQALRSVVADKQIESDSLGFEDRKNLAGVKAEVLYQWTAVDPARANELRTLLPGPVSQRIWNNVVDAQDRNLRESAVVGADVE